MLFRLSPENSDYRCHRLPIYCAAHKFRLSNEPDGCHSVVRHDHILRPPSNHLPLREIVGFGEHRIMFRPRDSYDQRLIDARLDIQPRPKNLRWLHDVFGNCVAIATFDTKAKS